VRSLLHAQNVRLGFTIENRVTAEVNLKDHGSRDYGPLTTDNGP